jgi:NADPH:quinone reductase-like Zn-dependent oxidoreductase
MKAVVQGKYGPPDEVLQLREIDAPVAGNGEVLVRVRAASVHPDVWHMVTGRPYVLRFMGAGVLRPKHPVPGTDLAGKLVSVGKGVTRFKAGDEVFGESFRKHEWKNGGTFAEYAAVPEETLALKPGGISFEQASVVPTSGIIVLNNLRNERVKPGQRVLINGAGGGAGAIAAQLAKASGAHVTGVDGPESLPPLVSVPV